MAFIWSFMAFVWPIMAFRAVKAQKAAQDCLNFKIVLKCSLVDTIKRFNGQNSTSSDSKIGL